VAELDMRCSCPDFAVPCKHLAATFYLLAETFDVDPFQLLRWRGRSRERLLDRLRELRSGGAARLTEEMAAQRPATEPVAGTAGVLADLPAAAVAGSADRFWSAPVPLPRHPPTPAAAPNLLLRQLGPPAAELGGPGLVERLRRAYERFAVLGEPDGDG
jgi:uncharacterized Zn finger protein